MFTNIKAKYLAVDSVFASTSAVVFICGVNCLVHHSIHRCVNKFTEPLTTSHHNAHSTLPTAYCIRQTSKCMMFHLVCLAPIFVIFISASLFAICCLPPVETWQSELTVPMPSNSQQPPTTSCFNCTSLHALQCFTLQWAAHNNTAIHWIASVHYLHCKWLYFTSIADC